MSKPRAGPEIQAWSSIWESLGAPEPQVAGISREATANKEGRGECGEYSPSPGGGMRRKKMYRQPEGHSLHKRPVKMNVSTGKSLKP